MAVWCGVRNGRRVTSAWPGLSSLAMLLHPAPLLILTKKDTIIMSLIVKPIPC